MFWLACLRHRSREEIVPSENFRLGPSATPSLIGETQARHTMSASQDRPNPTLAALREGLSHLLKSQRFDEAADYALALTEEATRYLHLDAIADGISRTRPKDALALYERALLSAQIEASYATSGGEGRMYMTGVHRLERKVDAARKALADDAALPKP